MPSTADLLEFARSIDPERAPLLERELGVDSAGRALGVLLATAFPPLTPAHAWQIAALERIAEHGWRAQRSAERVGSTLLTALGDLHDPEASFRELRRSVWQEKARIALRELLPPQLGGAEIGTTARELSELADACFEAALFEADRHIALRYGKPLRADGEPSTFVVFGLGKLGGLELNAGSDVDVVFIYDTDDGGSELALHEHWSRVARRLVATLDSASGDGMIWRVDLRLRPEGSQGPIVNSVVATERYYETWGRLWERAALLRARAIAGNLELGDTIQNEVFLPFVYRRDVDPNVATALAELVHRARAELSRSPERDLKLGPGGIREAEFFIQSLQLIWGGREPTLRVPGSIPALARLEARGLVTGREARDIASGYAFLRRLEHRVQWFTGVQTHNLPEGDALAKIARTLGLRDERPLLAELKSVRQRVADLFAGLAPAAPRPVGRYQRLLNQLHGTEDGGPDPTVSWFGGFEITDHLHALARRPSGLLGAATMERHPALVDRVLETIADASDVEQAARYLRAFFVRFADPSPYVAALAEQPMAVRRLITALGASAFVGDAIVSRPDLADVILFGGGTTIDPRHEVAVELQAATLRPDDDDDPRHGFLAALRRAKRRVMIEVAVADLAGTIDTRETTRLLSDLADEVLDRTVRFELGDPSGLAVIAVGKLGGRDIGYGSDLDVLFIYDPERAQKGEEAGQYFVARAQRVLRQMAEPHPAGPGYELDTRLRPSGSHGWLVTSLSSFATYHGVNVGQSVVRGSRPAVLSSGAAWERQALLRARFCAGDADLGREVIAVAETAAYERGAPPVAELHRLRMRMERELAREREGHFDLKLGRGGLLDVEFAAQWLQMRHGSDRRVRSTDTLDALEALHARGYLDASGYETFRDGYLFLRRLEQRIHVLHGAGSTIIDARQPGLPTLARRVGIQGTSAISAKDALLARYHEVTSLIRAEYERVLGVTST